MSKSPDFDLAAEQNYIGNSFTSAKSEVAQEQNAVPTRSYRLVLHNWWVL